MSHLITAWLAMSVGVGLGWALRAILSGQSRDVPDSLPGDAKVWR